MTTSGTVVDDAAVVGGAVNVTEVVDVVDRGEVVGTAKVAFGATEAIVVVVVDLAVGRAVAGNVTTFVRPQAAAAKPNTATATTTGFGIYDLLRSIES